MGRKLSLDTRKKISESHKGEKSYLWLGGITDKNMKIRNSFEYKEWRKSVFERDNYYILPPSYQKRDEIVNIVSPDIFKNNSYSSCDNIMNKEDLQKYLKELNLIS
jgi:hypothetical protein